MVQTLTANFPISIHSSILYPQIIDVLKLEQSWKKLGHLLFELLPQAPVSPLLCVDGKYIQKFILSSAPVSAAAAPA